MSCVIFDSFALLAVFREETGHQSVIAELSQISTKHPGYMCVINLGELYYITRKKQNTQKADLALSAALQMPIIFVEADFPLTYRAAILKSMYAISYADAFAAALTIEKRGTLITGDPEFKKPIKRASF